MIDPGSLLGFGIAFVVIAVLVSAIGCAVLAATGGPLARRGAAVERRVVEAAARAPIAIATIVVAALILHSATAADHCPSHGHHAHLCLVHGGVWLDRPWAVALGAAALVVAIGRGVLLAAQLLRGRDRVRALARSAHRVDDVRLVESPRAFCFVAGLRRPAVYASTAAWAGLADDERIAMLAHERAHVAGRDVARRTWLELATLISAPLAPGFLAARWEAANERLRDADAARVAGADAVARALVRMCRLGAASVAGAAFEPDARTLVARVETVLDGAPTGEPLAARLGAAMAAAIAAVAVAAACVADPLHHALETLLG